MISHDDNIEKYGLMNDSTSNETIKNDVIYNPSNKPINDYIYINSMKIPDINDIIKAFDELGDVDSLSSQSKAFTSNLKYLEKTNNKNDFNVQTKNNCQKKMKSKKFIITKFYEKDKQIFSIQKKKKLGRIRKNLNKKGKHDKYRKDNIIRRFKVHLMKNIYHYINSSFNINIRNKNPKNINMIKIIPSDNIKLTSKKENISWLNSTIKNIFSQKISSKVSTFPSDYNKKLINKIYEEKKEIKVINILEKTIREMWLIYINNDDESYPGFTKLKDDIIKLKNLGENECYINLYIQIAQKFEEIYNCIIPRKIKNIE